MSAVIRSALPARLVLVGACLAGAVHAADSEPLTLPVDRPLKVAVVPITTVVEWRGDRPAGAIIDIWDEAAKRLGVSSEFVRVPTFAALLEAVRTGTADVALGPMAISEERERVADLTHSVYHSGMRIAVRRRQDTGFLSAIVSLVTWKLAAACGGVLLLVLASGHLLWSFERRHNPRCFPDGYRQGIGEAVWWIVSVIVTGGCDDKHVDSVLGRLIAFGWMIGGIVGIAAFTSLLTATLTAERVSGSIHGPRDLAGRVVGCLEQAVTVQSIRQRGGIPREFPTIEDVLQGLELGAVEAAVAENHQLVQLLALPQYGGLRLVGPMFDAHDYAMALPTGSPFREPLNTLILRMREDGTLTRVKERWNFELD